MPLLIENVYNRRKVYSLSSSKVEMYLCAACHASSECVEKLNRHCGSCSGQGIVHVQALDENSA